MKPTPRRDPPGGSGGEIGFFGKGSDLVWFGVGDSSLSERSPQEDEEERGVSFFTNSFKCENVVWREDVGAKGID